MGVYLRRWWLVLGAVVVVLALSLIALSLGVGWAGYVAVGALVIWLVGGVLGYWPPG